MKFNIIGNRKYFYAFSATLILISLFSLSIWGLKPGIDFTGGSLLELTFKTEQLPNTQEIQATLADFDLGDIQVQPAGADGLIMRFKDVDEDTHQQILSAIRKNFSADGGEREGIGIINVTPEGEFISSRIDVQDDIIEERFESIGPIIGQEIRERAWIAIVVAVAMIIAYITYVFRRVSKPVASWKYGVAAIIALIHDIVIVMGLFAILGRFAGVEVNALFITALLTILGFSINDTIVVFDRTRENLTKHYSGNFSQVVNDSVNQTLIRSINTSLTTLLILMTLYLFGGATITNFILALMVGFIIGTYSSIFVASPVIVSWHNFSRRVKS